MPSNSRAGPLGAFAGDAPFAPRPRARRTRRARTRREQLAAARPERRRRAPRGDRSSPRAHRVLVHRHQVATQTAIDQLIGRQDDRDAGAQLPIERRQQTVHDRHDERGVRASPPPVVPSLARRTGRFSRRQTTTSVRWPGGPRHRRRAPAPAVSRRIDDAPPSAHIPQLSIPRDGTAAMRAIRGLARFRIRFDRLRPRGRRDGADVGHVGIPARGPELWRSTQQFHGANSRRRGWMSRPLVNLGARARYSRQSTLIPIRIPV